VLISASPTLTQYIKFAIELGRNFIITINISYRRARYIVGIETTAILGMSYVIHIVAEGTLIAIGRAKYKNQFCIHAAKECLQKISI
jgi:hypothetical protein